MLINEALDSTRIKNNCKTLIQEPEIKVPKTPIININQTKMTQKQFIKQDKSEIVLTSTYQIRKRHREALIQEKMANKLNAVLNLTEANEQKNNHQIEKIKRILEKSNHLRTEDEIDEVVKLIKHNKFFQGKNLKDKDLLELVSAFKF